MHTGHFVPQKSKNQSLSSNVCTELKEGIVSHLKVTKIPDCHFNGHNRKRKNPKFELSAGFT